MHETSLARSLLRQVAEISDAHAHAQVSEVRVEMGPLAGVEPVLLTAAFERLAADWGLERASLRIDHTPLEAHCTFCEATFAVAGFRFVCPRCAGTQCRVVRGEGLILESVVFVAKECDEASAPGRPAACKP